MKYTKYNSLSPSSTVDIAIHYTHLFSGLLTLMRFVNLFPAMHGQFSRLLRSKLVLHRSTDITAVEVN